MSTLAKEKNEFIESEDLQDNKHKHYKKLLRIASKYPKYSNLSFIPIISTLCGVSIHVFTAFYMNKMLSPKHKMHKLPKHAMFGISYWIFQFIARMIEAQTTSIFYEAMWGCNVSILTAAIGCFVGKPLLISMSMTLVAIDQISFFVDCFGYLLTKKYPIGSAAYMSDHTTTNMRMITSLHHLWFLPYCFYLLHVGKTFIHRNTFKATIVCGSVLTIIGRLFCREYVWMPMTKTMKERMAEYHREEAESLGNILSDDGMHYLEYKNINCGYEVMKDINIPFLHACDGKNVMIYYPYLWATMHALNYVPYWAMKKISDSFLMPQAVCLI